MSDFIYINGENFRVENEAHFANILEEKLGRDAADLFRKYIRDRNPEECAGECDRLYEMQERYDTAIRDALDALESLKPGSGRNRPEVKEAVDILREAMA